MRLKRINNRVLEVRNNNQFWDSQISPESAKMLLLVKDKEAELKTENGNITVLREGKKFFIELEENSEEFGALHSRFVLWQSDLEKIASSPKRKFTKETLRTAVNAPLYPRFRNSIRAFKKALRKAKRRSCFLNGFEHIKGVTALSAEKFLRQQGFRVSPEGELFHPRGRKNTFEQLSQYKNDKLLEEFGLL